MSCLQDFSFRRSTPAFVRIFQVEILLFQHPDSAEFQSSEQPKPDGQYDVQSVLLIRNNGFHGVSRRKTIENINELCI